MRTRVRQAVLGLLAALVLCSVWTAVELVQVRKDLTAARDLLERAAEADETSAALPRLEEARDLLTGADRRLGRPGPWLVARLPFAGRSIEATRRTAAAGAAVVDSGIAVLEVVPDQLLVDGRLDLAGTERIENALRAGADSTRRPVRRLRDADLTGVPSAVARPVGEAQRRLADTSAAMLRGADGLAAVRGIFGSTRERRLLIVLQNNAELRATGGLVSVFTEATARDGLLTLERFQEVDDVADPSAQARPVPAPAEFLRLYGPYKAATTLWKNVNMAADVPTSSQVLAEVAAATLPAAPDAIVWVDVPAIGALLRATGPVALPDGSELNADNVVRRLLSDAYATAAQDDQGQENRRDELRAAADAVIGQLLSAPSETSTPRLARELAAAGAGRHIALWSASDQEQRQLVHARLAGEIGEVGDDLSSFTVHNLGGGGGAGNKLDYYSRRQVSVRVEVGPESALVEQEFAVRNTSPPRGLPVYVAGRDRPGTTNNLVTIAVPASAEVELIQRDGLHLQVEPAPLAGHSVLEDVVSIAPGQTVAWRVRYRLPLEDGSYSGELLPQPLAVDALLLEVRPVAGRELEGGTVTFSGPYEEVERVDVQLRALSTWRRATDAVRRFWNEPVRLG